MSIETIFDDVIDKVVVLNNKHGLVKTADVIPMLDTLRTSLLKDRVEARSDNTGSPKLPTIEEVYASIQCGPYIELSYRERHVLDACYEFICRIALPTSKI